MLLTRLHCLTALSALVLVAAACGNGNKSQNAVSSATQLARASASASASATEAATASANTPVSASPASSTTTPSATSTATALPTPGDCLKFSYQPVSAADGTAVPNRPELKYSDTRRWIVPSQYIPPGFVSQGMGDDKAEFIDAAGLARGTADPQATLLHLQQIGAEGGRHQQWAAPPTQGGLYPVIDILHAIFGNDPGAANFLKNPAVNATACVRDEPGPTIGQETRHFQFSAPVTLPGGGTGTESGHEVMWRCGRVVISVTEVGAPGQFTQGMVDDLARNVQALFVKTDPCS